MPLANAINGRTKLVGVMGWPVEHSLSPQMHNAALAALGLNHCYVPLAVAPERLRDAVAGLRALDFVGCNVTVPHKQAVREYMQEISEEAQAVGAVNTLVRRGDGWAGYNSDVPGFLATLANTRFAPTTATEEGFECRGKRTLILGAGGAARGIIYALARSGATVVIVNRTPSRAEALAREMSLLFPGAALEALPLTPAALKKEAETAHLLVNTTTVGMWPETAHSLWPDELAYPPHLTLFDLIYNPLRTRLIAQAEAAGARTISGLKMLVYQGAFSFRWWFGVMPPVDVMYQVCLNELAANTRFAPTANTRFAPTKR